MMNPTEKNMFIDWATFERIAKNELINNTKRIIGIAIFKAITKIPDPNSNHS